MHQQAAITILYWPEALTSTLPQPLVRALESVAELKCFPPQYASTAVEASRELKIRARELMTGDFTYLDADTIVYGSLTHDLGEYDIGCCLDRYYKAPLPCTPNWVRPLFKQLNWNIPRIYFNSGFIVWKDSTRARSFSDSWLRNWLLCIESKQYKDQLSFNYSVSIEQGAFCKTLPIEYNALVDADARLAKNAKMVHYFNSRKGQKDSIYFKTIRGLSDSDSFFDTDRLADMLDAPREEYMKLGSCLSYRALYYQRVLRQAIVNLVDPRSYIYVSEAK
ncbi:hypothetical protein [Nibricoccus sp. IMCC34717]|uniref:hypothetical protein n=1 Tax=Nibricoccus sp. IMCC34717 TaxID=3034021 RepID=UPI0038516DC6